MSTNQNFKQEKHRSRGQWAWNNSAPLSIHHPFYAPREQLKHNKSREHQNGGAKINVYRVWWMSADIVNSAQIQRESQSIADVWFKTNVI